MSSNKFTDEFNELAKSITDTGIDDLNAVDELRQKNPAAVALGRLGGLKGGKARAEKLSAVERKNIAKKAAQARWKGK